MRALLKTTKALSDRTRLRILRLLSGGELCVCQVVAALQLAPSTVSRHLSLLEDAGLVAMRRNGRWAYYRLPAARQEGIWTWLGPALREVEGPDAQTRARMRSVALPRRQHGRTCP